MKISKYPLVVGIVVEMLITYLFSLVFEFDFKYALCYFLVIIPIRMFGYHYFADKQE